jgi:hypothetical protein
MGAHKVKIKKATDALLVRRGALGGEENLWPYGIYLKGNPVCVVTISSEFLSLARGSFPIGPQRVLTAGTGKMAVVYPYHSA